MTHLITGGAGCIGSDLARLLVERGEDVLVADNLSSGKLEHLSALQGRPNFRLVRGDLTEDGFADSLMGGVQFVHHLAANPDVKFTPGDPTDKDLRQNTLVTYYLLEAMRRHGVRRLAFSSTSAVYGLSDGQPIAEHTFCPKPISLYGATKLGCEGMICAFAHLFGIQAWIFRFANIVGAKVRKKGGTVIGDFISRLERDPTRLRILGDGLQAKSYLLSQECVEAMAFATEHARAPMNIYNLGCDDSLQVTRIADLVAEAMKLKNVAYEFTGGEGGWPGDVPRFVLDVSAINQLGWKAKHTSEEAVRSAIESTLATMRGRERAKVAVCKP